MDIAAIKTAFLSVVGFSQNDDPNGYQLDSDIIKSIDVLAEHPMLTHTNLESVAPDFVTRYPAHDNTKADYAINTIVRDTDENYYIAAIANPGLVLTVDTDWTPYSPYSEWLKTYLNNGIERCIKEWQNLNTLERHAKSLLKYKKSLFPIQLSDTKEVNNSLNVGLEILPKRYDSVNMSIYEVGLQFDTAQTVTLKLYDLDNQYTGHAVDSYDFVYTTPNVVQWFTQAISIDSNQNYWLTYDQDDITGQAINGLQQDGYINSRELGYPVGGYVTFMGFNNTGIDFTQNNYNNSTNYGLNIKFDVRSDITSLIVDHKEMFTNAISKKVGMDLLRHMAFNVSARTNRNQNNIEWAKQDLLYEIDGDSESMKKSGLMHEYQTALKAIDIDMRGTDPVAVPEKRSRVTHKFIG